MLTERDAEIAFSPGFRWGPSLLPGQTITWDDIYSETAMTYPTCYRLNFKGAMLKTILEDVADNLFNPDPYYQQGGDMVRIGGMGYTINVDGKMGGRVSGMTLLKTGKPIDPNRDYVVAGWASINPQAKGPAIWDVVAQHIKNTKVVSVQPNDSVKVLRS
jgi:sulfur-oxidizing protein SoxB